MTESVIVNEDSLRESIHGFMSDIITDPVTYEELRPCVQMDTTVDGKELDWHAGSEVSLMFDKIMKEYIEKLKLLFGRV